MRGTCLAISSSYRKPHLSFRLVQKWVTLNDLERKMALILRYFTEFGIFRGALRKSG